MATSSLSPIQLADLCRVLRHSLAAGLPLSQVFRQQAQSGPAALRALAGEVARDLERGNSLESALQAQRAHLPPLFLALAAVGEQAGALVPVFAELERHFQLQHQLRRQFLAASARPAAQLLAAIIIIALLIWVLGFIADVAGMPPIDPLGIGLVGGRGALVFLILAGGAAAVGVGLVALAMRAVREPAFATRMLHVPVIGPCVLAVALGRLSLALRLTLATALPVAQALTLSLRATGNAAFTARIPDVVAAVDQGRDLAICLSRTGLLPAEFQQALTIAEASGQVPAEMARQAAHYQEEAQTRLTRIVRGAAWLIWLVMAVLIGWAVIRIFSNVYLGPIDAFS